MSGILVAVDGAVIARFEALDKWKQCVTTQGENVDATKIPNRMVYQHNKSRAAGSGFPSALEVGHSRGLTDHEAAAIFGWTTGDYRFINPIARGNETTEFSDYPFLPHQITKVNFVMMREEVLPYIQILSVALSKLPTQPGDQRLWRGHMRPLPDATQTVGATFLMKGFTSVTRDRENALEFCIKNSGESPKQMVLLAIVESISGRCVSKFSARSEEMEVLFPLDTMFEVVEPPADYLEIDQNAVQQATKQVQNKAPGTTITLVYVMQTGERA